MHDDGGYRMRNSIVVCLCVTQSQTERIKILFFFYFVVVVVVVFQLVVCLLAVFVGFLFCISFGDSVISNHKWTNVWIVIVITSETRNFEYYLCACDVRVTSFSLAPDADTPRHQIMTDVLVEIRRSKSKCHCDIISTKDERTHNYQLVFDC